MFLRGFPKSPVALPAENMTFQQQPPPSCQQLTPSDPTGLEQLQEWGKGRTFLKSQADLPAQNLTLRQQLPAVLPQDGS